MSGEAKGFQAPGAEELIGVDEAGRGPVLGPLVIVGVRIRDDRTLRELGVRDSKLCTPETRRRLGAGIRRLCEDVVVRKIPAEEIDSYRDRGSLNELEAEVFADVIKALLTSRLPAGRAPSGVRVFVDAVDTDAHQFGLRVLHHLGLRIELVSEHRADVKYPVVSAASILAKLIRDEEMEKISREAGEDAGSGYPADPVTIAYIKKYFETTGTLPPHTRTSWETVRKLVRQERKLDEFAPAEGARSEKRESSKGADSKCLRTS
ncbi:MAG: ribonuclease HII [Thermoplasmata archaeon]